MRLFEQGQVTGGQKEHEFQPVAKPWIVRIEETPSSLKVPDSLVSMWRGWIRSRIVVNSAHVQDHVSRGARPNQHFVVGGASNSNDDESVLLVEFDHCGRVIGGRFVAGTRGFKVENRVATEQESALSLTARFGKQRAAIEEILHDTGPQGDDPFPFEIVRVTDQVAYASQVKEMCGTEILPEFVLHSFGPADEFPDLQ